MGSPVTENPPPPALRITSYDVIVGGATVRVLPTYDPTAPAYCTPSGVEDFPAPGECTTQSDAIGFPCEPLSDVTRGVVDSAIGLPDAQSKAIDIVVTAGADSVLHLDGSLGRVDVPLHASGLPTPTITSTSNPGGLDFTWTTDVPSALSLFEFAEGLASYHCLIDGQSNNYHFNAGTPTNIRVQPFLAVEITQTPYGEIRVWRGIGKAL